MSHKAALLVLFLLSGAPALAISQQSPANKDQIEQHERLAQQYLAERKPDLAIPELEKVVALDPGNVDACANLGVLLFFHRDYAQAIPHLQAAIRLKPDLPKIQALLGLAEEHTSNYEDARKDLETAFPRIQEQKLKVEVGLDLVGLYNGNSDLDSAASIISALRKEDPENPQVLYAAYRTYADLSGESMLSLSLVAPDSAQMHQLLAHEESREGNTNGAIAEYRKAIAIDPHLPGVHYELAELLNTSEDAAVKKEAEAEFRTAVADNQYDEKSICELAEFAEAGGDLQQADDEYTKAVAMQPGDASAKLGLAKVLIELDQRDKALALLESSEQLEPTNATVHYRLATLYKKMGHVEEAKREVQLYEKYKAMKEKLHAVYKGLGVQPDEIRADEAAGEEADGTK